MSKFCEKNRKYTATDCSLCTAKVGTFCLISPLLINAEAFIAYRAVFELVFYRIRSIDSMINYSFSMWTAAYPTVCHDY